MDIKNIAYELYKQQWLMDHFTETERMDNLREYYKYVARVSTKTIDYDDYDTWTYYYGYSNSGMYATFDEFCLNEFMDCNIMRELLKDRELLNMYYAYFL
jgi:hypothetical protein